MNKTIERPKTKQLYYHSWNNFSWDIVEQIVDKMNELGHKVEYFSCGESSTHDENKSLHIKETWAFFNTYSDTTSELAYQLWENTDADGSGAFTFYDENEVLQWRES